MVFVTVPVASVEALARHLEAQDIKALVHGPRLRLVTHLDLDSAAVERIVAAFSGFYNKAAVAAD